MMAAVDKLHIAYREIMMERSWLDEWHIKRRKEEQEWTLIGCWAV